MTDDASSTSHPAQPDETEASLRAILRDQIAGAESDAQANLEALLRAAAAGGDTGLAAEAQNNLASIGRLQRRIDNAASPAVLGALRAEVIAIVAATQATTQQAQPAGASGRGAEAALHAASEAARKTVSDFSSDFYGRKIFDKYLEFSTPEEAEAYRKRAAEYQQEIEKAKALHTPEGDLLAIRLAKAQFADAKAHGADRSPDAPKVQEALDAAEAGLVAQLPAQSKEASRSATKSAPVDDPLDKVAPVADIPADVLARLRAAGVVVADQSQHGHGVNSRDRSAAPVRGQA